MKKILLVVSIVAIVIACSKETDDATKPLVVAMELQYPPFEMSDKAGNPAGVSVEIAKALGEYLKRPVVIENIAWTGLIPSLQTGKADIIISSMTITEERQQVVDFSDPYIKSGLTLLIAKKSSVNSFNDLNRAGVVVAVKSGTTGATIAKDKLTQADVRYFDEVAACVLEVSQGKADAFIYDVLTVYENYNRHKESTRINIEAIPGSDGYWGMAVKKGNDALLKDVNSFIKEFRLEGGFDRLGDKHLGYIKELFEKNKIAFFFDI